MDLLFFSWVVFFFSHNALFSVNLRLGPPDYYPQTPSCPEENLTREYAQSGYKETVEGLEVHLSYQQLLD